MPIAPPDRFEWVPTSAEVNPSFSTPKESTVKRMRCRNIEAGMVKY